MKPAFAGILLAVAALVIPAAVSASPASASACTISEDVSTPAVAHTPTYGNTTLTTASFSPPAGSMLEVVADALHAGDTVTLTDSVSGTYTAGPHIQGTTQAGSIYFFQRYLTTAPGAMTVTAHISGTTVATTSLAVRVVDNAASSQTGAASATKTGNSTAQNGSLTTTTAGSWVYVDMGNGNATETVTPLSTTSNVDVWKDTAQSGNLSAVGRSASATVTPGATSFGWTGSGSNNYVWAAQEMLPAQTCGTQAVPVVTTNAATGVGQTTATLNGSVNPEGAATTYKFDYGTSISYGTSVPSPAGSAGSGTTSVSESVNLTGLTAATTYHYRIEATNSGGTSFGADQTFTTSAASVAPVVTTNAATGIDATIATLNGSVNPEGQAATYQFDYGTTTAYGTSVPSPAGSAGSGNVAVNESYSLTGLTANTVYHYRIEATNATGTTLGADQQFTTAPVNLLSSKLGLYNGIIGAWEGPTDPPFANATVIADQTAAKPLMTQDDTYDCFTDQTCGRDNHTGLISRASFDSEIQKITGATGYNTPLWFKLLPIAKGSVNNEPDGSQFCPPPTNWGMNLALFKSQLDEIKAAGYTGPIVLESNNEAEFDCWAYWATFNSAITGAGSVGVSKNIGDMYAATMPALVKYARSIGFTQVVSDGYIGISGGPGWGQTCTQDGTGTWGWSCGYQARWIDEFNTEVHNAYVANGNDPDYLPNAESIHAYPHGSDFTSTAGYDFPDGEAYQYYRNWLVKSRAELDTIWGATNGDSVRFAISEWNAGYSRGGTSDWVGWTTAGAPGAFYDGWYGMLRGDGNTQGAGTRYWSASLFDIASNSDTGTGKYYNYIHQDGTTPAWYANYKNDSLTDPNR